MKISGISVTNAVQDYVNAALKKQLNAFNKKMDTLRADVNRRV